MSHCKNCINWVDQSLDQIEAQPADAPRTFMGCRIYGFLEDPVDVTTCKHYVLSENLYTICGTCRITVPKVCVSLGECVNCTDTDLFCVESCIGGEARKYCTHFVRLHTDGIQLIENDQVFDLFPTLDMPKKQ